MAFNIYLLTMKTETNNTN